MVRGGASAGTAWPRESGFEVRDTPLDLAHAAMATSPEDEAARLSFYDRLASAVLFLLLEVEPEGDQITPRLFPVENANVSLVFDTEERLAELAGAAPYARMTGRQLAQLLRGQGVGLGLNLGVAPSSFLLDAAGLDWFADMLSREAEAFEARPEEVFAPSNLPEALLTALDAKFAGCAGLARGAYLSGARYTDGSTSHILAFLDPTPGAEPALAMATREALAFSAVEAGFLDVLFLKAEDPISPRIAKIALRFDLPDPMTPDSPEAPGTDPDKPPRLR